MSHINNKDNKMKLNLGIVKLDITVKNSKFKFIDGVDKWWRLWSIRFGILGTAILAFPDTVYQVWLTIPPEIRPEFLSVHIDKLGMIMMIASVLSRVIKQPKLIGEIKKEEQKIEEKE